MHDNLLSVAHYGLRRSPCAGETPLTPAFRLSPLYRRGQPQSKKMKKTSIHIRPCNVGVSEQHNNREKELDYVRADLSHLNEKIMLDARPLEQTMKDLSVLVKTKTGRRMQAKAKPLKEGVIVIDENTSMQQLSDFGDKCKEKWGITPLQIYLHRDEGHYNDKGKWKPNYHAHIVFNYIDTTTGKTINLNRKDLSEMQTLLADTLQMQRGQSSDKKHLSSLQFKNEKLREQIADREALKAEIDKAKDLTAKTVEEIEEKNKRKGWFRSGIDTNSAYEDLKYAFEVREKMENVETSSKISMLESQNATLQREKTLLKQELDLAEDYLREVQDDIDRISYKTSLKEHGFDTFWQWCKEFNTSSIFREDRKKENPHRGEISMFAAIRMFFENAVIRISGIMFKRERGSNHLLADDKRLSDIIDQRIKNEQEQDRHNRQSRGFRL